MVGSLEIFGGLAKAVFGGIAGAITTRCASDRFGWRAGLKQGATELHVEFGLLAVAEINDEPGLGSREHLVVLWREHRISVLRWNPDAYVVVERAVRRMIVPETGDWAIDSHNVEVEAAMVALEPIAQVPPHMRLTEPAKRVRLPRLRQRDRLAPLALQAG